MANEEKPKKKGFFQEFKEFLARGNVLDLAVAVIIGAAFGAIVTSLVNDIIMPLVGLAMGGKSLNNLCLVLNNVPQYIEVDGVPTLNPDAILWNYGNFIQSIINFLIIALVVFCFIKVVMKIKSAGEELHHKYEEGVADRVNARRAAEAAENAEETKTE